MAACGSGMAAEAGGHQIALFNVDGTVSAIEGTCTHRGGPLGEGSLEGTTVTCPWHGATFDVRTGNHLTAPAVAALVRQAKALKRRLKKVSRLSRGQSCPCGGPPGSCSRV